MRDLGVTAHCGAVLVSGGSCFSCCPLFCPCPLSPSQFSSVQSLSRVRLWDPMNRSKSGLPVHHQLPEFTNEKCGWSSDGPAEQ